MDEIFPIRLAQVSEQKKWDSYYADLPLGEEDELTRQFNAQLTSAVSAFLNPGSHILEAGCGGGSQSLALARTGLYTVSLMDFSDSALGYARRLFQRDQVLAQFLAGDVFAPGQPDYDLVFNAGVLEHYTLAEQAAFLRGMASRSRQFVLALVPNRQCYWYWLWRVRSAANGQWPFGKEVPMDDLAAAFESAGLSVVGRAYLGEAWTESFINSLAKAAPELREQIVAVHRSPLIPAAQKSYLVACLGVVPGVAAPSLAQWTVPGTMTEMQVPEALAALSDALALRLGADKELMELRSQLTKEQQIGQEVRSRLAASAQAATAFEQSAFDLRAQLTHSQQAALTDALALRLGAEQELRELRSQLTKVQQIGQEVRSQLAASAQAATAFEQSVFDLRAQLALSQLAATDQTQRLAEVSSQLGTHQSELAEKNRLLAEAQKQVQAQAKAIAGQEAAIAERDKGIAWLRAELSLAQAASQRMTESKFWRLGLAYWTVRAVLLRALKSILPARTIKLATRIAAPAQVSVPAPAPADDVLAEAHDFYSGLTLRPDLPTSQLPPILASRPLPRLRREDIICFSIIDWSFRYQRPQQMMSQFAAHGHRVFYINLSQPLPANSPKSFVVRPIKENVYELFLSAGRALDIYSGLIEGENRAALLAALDDLRRAYDITDAVGYIMIASWGGLALEARQRWGWRIIYDCMDEWENFPGIGRSILAMERQVVHEADLVVVTAQRLYDKWRSLGRSIVLARNAVDLEFYQARLQPNNLLDNVQHPVVGYYGAIADWFDLDLMQHVAQQRPEYTFVLIGGIFDVNVSRLRSMPNVRLLGQQPYETMPAYLYHFDACIIPFKINSITQATDPVKLYEYLSAGKPVVAVALAELELYREHIYLSANREEFLTNLDAAVAENDLLRVQRRKAVAESNTWPQRYQAVAQAWAAQVPRVSIIVVTYNNLALSRLCLESIIRNTAVPNYEVLVVDNNSTDGTQSYLQQLATEYANLRIILNVHNQGFAHANNQALEQASGEYLVMLNNDTIVPPGWLSRLLGHLQDRSLGLVGAVTNFAGNEAKLDVDYRTWREMEAFARAFTWQHEGELAEIPMLAMFCLGLRRDVYQALGPLDEQFGLGMFEDDDYAIRARHLGYQVVCATDVFVHHFGQAAFKELIRDGTYDQLFEQNRHLFEAKWQTKWAPHRHGVLISYRPDADGSAAVAAAPVQRQTRARVTTRQAASQYEQQVLREKQKWGDHLLVEASGAWNAWLDHPFISKHYIERSLIDGLRWEEWVLKRLGGPAQRSCDLGCGAGDRSLAVWRAGVSRYVEGVDISDDRVAEGERRRQAAGAPGHLWAEDVNYLALPENTYDLIFSCHSFHHFLELEAVMQQVVRALTPRGLFFLEEFVGPTQFQWTDLQIRLTRELLSALPEPLRRFREGRVKVFEGRPTVEQVVAVSPFESIRSAEIPALFQRYFKVVAVRNLGGTIQHLLYNGIIHNFDPSNTDANRYLRHIYEVEDNLIDSGQLPSDFRLLVGCKPDVL